MTPMLRTQVAIWSLATATKERLGDLVEELRTDERGDVSSTTVMIVVLCVLAAAVGAILYHKFTTAANNVKTGN